jgi:hypothetical protein
LKLADDSLEFKNLAEKYPNDNALTSVSKLLESFASTTATASTEIENLYRANSTLKIQTEVYAWESIVAVNIHLGY